MKPKFPIRIAFWAVATASMGTPGPTANTQSLRLAAGLVDKPAVCATYVEKQKEAISSLTSGWNIRFSYEAGLRIYKELLPLFQAICAKSVDQMQGELSTIIETEMSVGERGQVDVFLSSSVGRKFILGARDNVLSPAGRAESTNAGAYRPTAEEKAYASRVFGSSAWQKYKSIGMRGTALFGATQAQLSQPYADKILRTIKDVKASYTR